MKMAKPEEGVLKNGNYGATVAVKLVAPARNFAAAGVDKKFLFAEEEAAKETDSLGSAADCKRVQDDPMERRLLFMKRWWRRYAHQRGVS